MISPEGAASILWRDSARAKEAATNMKITSDDLKSLGVIDGIIPEPIGGAHRDPAKVITATGDVINKALSELSSHSANQIRAERRQKFLDIGRNL
ncbi:Acetyl-coenzyme A carboxylase carboxyl transferase subunit alpha [compost metagenome]